MKRILSIAVALLAALSVVSAQSVDSAVAEHRQRWNDILGEYRQNPAAMLTAYAASLTQMQVEVSDRRADRPVFHELGDGHTLTCASVQSYLKLGDRSTVWGGAAYQIGKKRNIKFNSTADYRLLRPYVMGDTLGGQIDNERYTFYGGYAVQAGRWQLGALLDFRAEHEYRIIDPRPRSIVTDLTLRLGAVYRLGRYKVGASLDGRMYKQTNNVDFYNPLGVIPELHFTGLGADYVRFSGAVRSCYYKATGGAVGLQLFPAAGSGAYAALTADYTPYQKILTELNALPISRLDVYIAGARAGWKQQGTVDWSLYAGVDAEQRNGNEHIAGNSSSTEYRSLITLTMYREHTLDAYAGGALRWGNRQPLTVELQAGYLDNAAEYIDLRRRMSYSKLYGRAGWQWLLRPATGWQAIWDGDIAYLHNISKHIVMPLAEMTPQITLLITDTYAAKTAHATQIDTGLRVYRYPARWKGVGVYLAAGASLLHMPINSQHTIRTAVGFVF